MKQLLFNSAAHLSKCLLVCVCLIAAGINSMARSNSPSVDVYASTLDDPTEKAIYCNDNRTLYFVYDTNTYTAGDTYTADDETQHAITAVYTGFKDHGYSYREYKTSEGAHLVLNVNGEEVNLANYASYSDYPWDYYARYIQTVDFQNSYRSCTSTSMACWFHVFSSLVEVKNASTNLKLDETTSLRYTFLNCRALTSLDVSGWDVSKVLNMNQTFSQCLVLTSLDVSNWDVSNVTDMNSTFQSCSKLTTLDVSKWNTSKVTSLVATFSGCKNVAALDVSNWDVSNVTNMTSTFQDCSILTTLDVSKWNTSKVTSLANTFYGCKNVAALDVSNWDVSNVTDMARTFWECTSVTELDVSKWNTEKVTNMNGTFYQCRTLTTLDVSKWDVSNVTNMYYTFRDCKKVTELDVSDWDVSNVTNMGGTFSYCSELTTLDVSKWDTGNATSMNATFSNCSKLTTLDVSNWNTENVTNMSSTFEQCKALTTLDVSNWNTANVTSMSSTFYYMESVSSLDLSKWNTEKVTNFGGSFGGFLEKCQNLTSITFGSDFSMDKVTSESKKKMMFKGCTKLRYIDFYASNNADAITTVNRTSGSNTMFDGTPATTVIYLPRGAVKLASGNEQNVVYTDGETLKCEDYYSEDKVDIELPRDFKAKKAQYSRPSMQAARKYGTCILPYAFHSNSDIQAYTLSEEHPETMYFVEADIVPAHTPFLFQKLGSAQFIMNGSTTDSYDITVHKTHDTSVSAPSPLPDGKTAKDYGPYSPDDPYVIDAKDHVGATPEETGLSWTTKGYYVSDAVGPDDQTFYIAQDKFWLTQGSVTLPPHRATFCGTLHYTTGSGAPSFSISIGRSDGSTTRIDASDIDREDVEATYYDAQGRRIPELRQGLNIVRTSDGIVRKVMVK